MYWGVTQQFLNQQIQFRSVQMNKNVINCYFNSNSELFMEYIAGKRRQLPRYRGMVKQSAESTRYLINYHNNIVKLSFTLSNSYLVEC